MPPLITRVHYVMHSILGGKVASVRATAARNGGKCTWAFSQVQNPVKSLICSHGDTSGGICEMLSAKWLEMHAKGDHMANWLQGRDGQIDASKVRYLMQLFAIGTTMAPGQMTERGGGGNWDQDRATQQWLCAKGVVRRGSIVGMRWGQDFLHGEQGANAQRGGRRRDFAAQLGRAITASYESYKMVGIAGPNFAHACAAWSAQDVAFFDPNFGEFWFEDPRAFERWFPQFWHAAGYGTPAIGLSESYSLKEYVLAR